MKTHITNYQRTDSEEVIGEKIEIKEGHLFVLSFGSLKFSFVTQDQEYEDQFFTITDQINDEDGYWLFDGDDDLDYDELDYAQTIDFDGEFYSKFKEFNAVEDSVDGISLVDIVIYKHRNLSDYFVIIGTAQEGEEKQVSYFKAKEY